VPRAPLRPVRLAPRQVRLAPQVLLPQVRLARRQVLLAARRQVRLAPRAARQVLLAPLQVRLEPQPVRRQVRLEPRQVALVIRQWGGAGVARRLGIGRGGAYSDGVTLEPGSADDGSSSWSRSQTTKAIHQRYILAVE
jgi:hypothetical protein